MCKQNGRLYRLDVTHTLLIIRFHMHPWNGTLTLLDVCSTSAGIPPRKMCCKLTGWLLGSADSFLASSSTWTAKDLTESKPQSQTNTNIFINQQQPKISAQTNMQKTNLPGSLSIRSECSLPSFSAPCSGRLMMRRGLWWPVNTRTSREPLFSMTER